MKAKFVFESDLFKPKSKSKILEQLNKKYLNRVFIDRSDRKLYLVFDILLNKGGENDFTIMIKPLFDDRSSRGIIGTMFRHHFDEFPLPSLLVVYERKRDNIEKSKFSPEQKKVRLKNIDKKIEFLEKLRIKNNES